MEDRVVTASAPFVCLSPRDYDTVLFDLDGVLNRRARMHAAAWKRLFDDFLQQRSNATGEPFIAFDVEADYRLYVENAEKSGTIPDIPTNHNPPFAPVIHPTLEAGVEALVVASQAWLAG